jgi:segregation and condensation protein A
MTESQPPPDAPAAAPPAEGEPVVGGYRVALPTFEGPLDLLLHLIEEHELDIRDIPIAFIAQKYVEYIMLMNELNIDVASEYLVMAATLAHIKSKSLLPTPPADDEEDAEDELDPRAELIRRLLEYQKYKHAGENLAAHDVLGRDVFPRGMPAPSVDGPAPITGLSLFKLLDAFQSVLSRAKATVDHQIDFERFSITDRINELSDILRVRPKLTFEELFVDQRSRGELIVTFLALLEMTRLRLTRLFQEGPLELIYIELSVSDDESKPSDEENAAGDEPGARADSSPSDNALEAEPESSESGDHEQSVADEDDGVLPDAER